MARLFYRFITVVMLGLLVGCSQLSHYSLSEQTINRYLAKHTEKTQRNFNLSGLVNGELSFNRLHVDIGREVPDKITLTGNATFTIASILGNQNATLELTLTARPEFDSVNSAVYLRELTLIDYDFSTSQGNVKNIKTFIPLLNSALQYYFDDQPVYVLNPDNGKLEATAQKLTKGIQVTEGALVFEFTQ